MPYGYTPPSWGTSTTGGNRPPSERVWEEDRRDETPVSVDYTRPVDTSQPVDRGDPIVPIDETIQQDLPVIENLGSSNLEKLLSDEERKWNFLNAFQNQWETEQYPLGTGNLGVSSPFALTAQNLGNPQGLAWQAALPYEAGSQLVDGEWKKPILSGLGEELYNYDWTDGGANPYGTIPNPEEIRVGSPIMEKMQGITKDYYGQETSDPWDDWWGSGGGQQSFGPAGMTLADLARRTWFSESLADVEAREVERLEEGLGVATMANMEQIYGPELAAEANPLADPEFSLAAMEKYDPLYGDLRLWQEAQQA